MNLTQWNSSRYDLNNMKHLFHRRPCVYSICRNHLTALHFSFIFKLVQVTTYLISMINTSRDLRWVGVAHWDNFLSPCVAGFEALNHTFIYFVNYRFLMRLFFFFLKVFCQFFFNIWLEISQSMILHVFFTFDGSRQAFSCVSLSCEFEYKYV